MDVRWPQIALCVAGLSLSWRAFTQDPFVAENAPEDCGALTTSDALRSIVDELSPEALKTWPTAKERFLAGLPEQHGFFVTFLVVDAEGRSEYLFIAVDEIVENEIRGRIWSDVKLIEGMPFRAPVVLPEDAISDWLITKPDGTEEGNIIGKYIDTLEQCQHRVDDWGR